MPAVHVLCWKECLDLERLAGRVVIVLDILFATSTIVHACSEGVDSVWPALDQAEATRIASSLDVCIVAGEHLAEPLPSFASATPLALGAQPLRGKVLVYCTTNGTVALRNAAGAAAVYAGALLNGAALVAHVVREHPAVPVLIVCSGSIGRFNLEDFYGAGHLVAYFLSHPGYETNDAGTAALLLYRGCDARAALLSSRVGKMMRQRSLQHEVEYAARLDTLDVVPRLQGGRLRCETQGRFAR
jgi:2-phosphosulfolactate phosphatase